MAKFTAAQVTAIETVLYHLKRAEAFINRSDVVVAVTKAQCTTTQDFKLADGTAATAIAKDIGSDLCGLEMGRHYLENMLQFHRK